MGVCCCFHQWLNNCSILGPNCYETCRFIRMYCTLESITDVRYFTRSTNQRLFIRTSVSHTNKGMCIILPSLTSQGNTNVAITQFLVLYARSLVLMIINSQNFEKYLKISITSVLFCYVSSSRRIATPSSSGNFITKSTTHSKVNETGEKVKDRTFTLQEKHILHTPFN